MCRSSASRIRVVARFTAVVARLRLGPQVCAVVGWCRVRVRCWSRAAVLWRLAGCDVRDQSPSAPTAVADGVNRAAEPVSLNPITFVVQLLRWKIIDELSKNNYRAVVLG